MKKSFLLFYVFILFFTSCETDFNINAKWKEVPIVYGILNQNDSIHYIKINKAFLGDESALVMAKIPDSSSYGANIKAFIIAYKNGAFFDSIPLDTVTINNKDTGLFYYPSQLVYKTSIILNESYYYKVYFKNIKTLKEFSSDSISLVQSQGFRIERPFGSTINFNGLPPYEPKLQFKTTKYGKRYQVSFCFYYSEKDLNTGISTEKYVSWNLGEIKTENIEGNEPVEISYGEQFYSNLQSKIKLAENVQRKSVKIEAIVYVAGSDLSTYMDVNSPSGSIVQERPQYSNIRGGFGVFSSRCDLRKTFLLDANALDSLVTGRYTKNLHFSY